MKKRSTESGADAFSQAPVNKDGIITGDMTEEMAAKTNAIIEKVDKESATRKFTGKIKSTPTLLYRGEVLLHGTTLIRRSPALSSAL